MVCSAATIVLHTTTTPVPTIPHGQDGISLPWPNPVIVHALLPLDDVIRILPAIPALVHDPRTHDLRTTPHGAASNQSVPFLAIAIATALLLAGYDLIPRAHNRLLRIRAMHLKQDLFT